MAGIAGTPRHGGTEKTQPCGGRPARPTGPADPELQTQVGTGNLITALRPEGAGMKNVPKTHTGHQTWQLPCRSLWSRPLWDLVGAGHTESIPLGWLPSRSAMSCRSVCAGAGSGLTGAPSCGRATLGFPIQLPADARPHPALGCWEERRDQRGVANVSSRRADSSSGAHPAVGLPVRGHFVAFSGNSPAVFRGGGKEAGGGGEGAHPICRGIRECWRVTRVLSL